LETRRRFADRNNLGVRGRIVTCVRLVAGLAYDFAGHYDNAPDRPKSRLALALLGDCKRAAHEDDVITQYSGGAKFRSVTLTLARLRQYFLLPAVTSRRNNATAAKRFRERIHAVRARYGVFAERKKEGVLF
jgi:hypothetical protein